MKNNICQSCGMPLYREEEYGTDHSGLHIEDYCQYCYKDGAFTSEVTMDEMIVLCSQYVKGNTREKAIQDMKKQFPSLKRWAQKEKTQNEYYRSINKVLGYIQQHLNQKQDINELAQTANISPFHFQRIFKTTIGETLGEYVLRLRMEYIVEQMKCSDKRLSELAIETGYSSEQALSRAFKKYFNIPPSAFKKSFFKNYHFNDIISSYRICKISKKNILSLSSNYAENNSANNANWKKLYMYAILNGLMNENTESIELVSIDNLTSQFKITPCLTVEKLPKKSTGVSFSIIEEGLYAIFTHRGVYSEIPDLYKKIITYWQTESKYKLCNDAHFIKYLNNPSETNTSNLLSEIYIPISQKIKL